MTDVWLKWKGRGIDMTERRAHLPTQSPIDAYGNGGFRFADMSHRGSLISLPSGMYAWDIADPERFSETDFADLFRETEQIDLLLIGTGREIRAIPEALKWRFRDRRIQVDGMQTGHAIRTYNILIGERRRVAGAFVVVD